MSEAPQPGTLPTAFAEALGRRANRLGDFAARVVWYDRVASTSDEADRLAWDGAAHGTVVVADGQESGRGRMGRAWHSPPGAGLYVSVVLRPDALSAGTGPGSALAASRVTLTAGVALAQAIRSATGLPVAIKWPNDIVVEGRKVCGILAEAAASSGGLRHIVLGLGINVLAAAYPPEIADRATSIQSELGRPVERGEVFAESIACLAGRLRDVSAGRFAQVLDAWRELSPSSHGTRVQVPAAGGWIEAVTAGLDDDGALVVRAEGSRRRVIAGEVRWGVPAGRIRE